MADLQDRLQRAMQDRYRLDREIGQGGMATVYLAEDVRHHRRVALKLLRPELAAVIGGERFLAEIRTTANLQHPHILPLFDSGEADGFLFYVMPYVAGESLRDRLAREKQLPVRDALRITAEVASALDYAHRHGVIHRDIKPENILLHDGTALVADFGIALAASRAGSGGRMTETGMSLGTPHYMSPEQAMGEREIGPASDVYALGAVAYEMLTGDPPFTGSTAQAIVARVVTEHPRPLTSQRHTIPSHVEAAVLTALEKLPADRFATAAEFAAALAGAGGDRPAGRPVRTDVSSPEASATPGMPRRRRVVPLVAGALLLAATAAAGGWLAARRSAPPLPVARVSLPIPRDMQLASFFDPVAALSPDGLRLVYTASGDGAVSRLYLRHLDALELTPLPGTENSCCPVFSPDGAWIAYGDLTTNTWRRVSARGGAPLTIPVRPPARVVALRWSGDDAFVATLIDGSLARLDGDGSVHPLARPDSAAGEATLDVMTVLPDGSALVVAVRSFPDGTLAVIGRDGRRRDVAVGPVNWAGWSAGYLLWSQPGSGVMNAARFDVGGARLAGPIEPLGIAAQQTRGSRPAIAQPAAAQLAYIPAQPLSLVQVNRSGQHTTLLGQPRSYHNPRISPDGRRISFDFEEGVRDVWLLDLRDTTMTRATFRTDGHDAFWLPDGSGFLFASEVGGRVGIFRRVFEVDEPDSVAMYGPQISVHAITPDGRTGVAAGVPPGLAGTETNVFDLLTVDLESGRLTPLATTRFEESYPALSPDGRWLAYVSTETGRSEVYVRPFGTRGGKRLVSQDGGIEPIWSRDGRELFYRTTATGTPQLMAAAVVTTPSFRVLSRASLFSDAEYETAVPHANYDVMPDGQSFVMVRQGRLGEFIYVQNWTEPLRRRGER